LELTEEPLIYLKNPGETPKPTFVPQKHGPSEAKGPRQEWYRSSPILGRKQAIQASIRRFEKGSLPLRYTLTFPLV
jgi:hypothetical protein